MPRPVGLVLVPGHRHLTALTGWRDGHEPARGPIEHPRNDGTPRSEPFRAPREGFFHFKALSSVSTPRRGSDTTRLTWPSIIGSSTQSHRKSPSAHTAQP